MRILLTVVSVVLALAAVACVATAAGLLFAAPGVLVVVAVACGYGAWLAAEAT